MLQGYFGQFLGDSEDGLLSITSHVTSLGDLTGSLSTFSIACRFRLARNGFPVGGTDVPGGPFTVLIVREGYRNNQAPQMHQYATRSNHMAPQPVIDDHPSTEAPG